MTGDRRSSFPSAVRLFLFRPEGDEVSILTGRGGGRDLFGEGLACVPKDPICRFLTPHRSIESGLRTKRLTPGRQPCFGGTFSPARDGDRNASMGFLTLLGGLDAAYHQHPDRPLIGLSSPAASASLSS